jgi:hypothetical protein
MSRYNTHRDASFSNMHKLNRYLTLLEDHFQSDKQSQHCLDFGDYYSRLLSPGSATNTALDHVLRAFCEVIVALGKGHWRHINYYTFRALFEKIDQCVVTPSILETGLSAHGTNSSLLFATLAHSSSGSFTTIDSNLDTVNRVRATLKSKIGENASIRCQHGDSVELIERYDGPPINIAYLDSYDLVPEDFPGSEAHGLAEFEALKHHLAPGYSLVLIDDTPKNLEIVRKLSGPTVMAQFAAYSEAHGYFPGKGARVIRSIAKDPRFQVISWEYQVLIQCHL